MHYQKDRKVARDEPVIHEDLSVMRCEFHNNIREFFKIGAELRTVVLNTEALDFC